MSIKSLILAAGLLAGTSLATLAQTVVIAPEQETVIREYIVKQEVQPVEIPDVEVTVGATLPETVQVHALDLPDLGASYSYVVADNRTLVVEPDTRKIVHIIE